MISLGLPIEALRADAQRYSAQQPFQAPVKDVNLVRNTVQLQVGGSAGYQWYRCFADIPLSDTLVGEMACVVFFDGEPVVAGFLWEEAGTFIHDHSSDDEGGQLDWDDVWSDAVHDHSSNAEGGRLDWDDVWTDAAHDHTVAGEGGQLDHGLALTGLGDDDHTIYLLASGARALTGAWDVGAFLVTFGAGIAFDGASGANVITVPTAQAQAFKLVDTNAVEHMRIDSAPQLEMIFNNGEADIDFRVAASGLANAFTMQGSSGHFGMGAAAVSSYHLRIFNNTINTDTGYVGLRVQHEKTAGGTDTSDNFWGIYNTFRINQSGVIIGLLCGIDNRVTLADGTVGGVGDQDDVSGISTRTMIDGTVYGVVYGLYDYTYISGTGVVNTPFGHVIGGYIACYPDGTIAGHASGAEIVLECDGAIAGDAYTLHLSADHDGTVTGTAYMLYLDENDGINYGIYQSGTAPHYFQGIADFSGGLRTIVPTDDISDPPTDAELDAALGTPAAVGEGFVGLVDDNNAETDIWLCIAIGASWFYATKLTKAV